MTGRLKNESGFALILTLVVTALMVAVVVEMIHQVYVDTSLSRGFRDGQQASILAESGVIAVKTELSKGITPAMLSTFLAQPLRDEDVGTLEIKISDESGKINVNDLVTTTGAYDVVVQNALKRLGTILNSQLLESIWPAVADWISPPGITHSGGAEASYYGTRNSPYKIRNSRLMMLTELSMVKGITPEIALKLGPYLRTFPDSTSTFVKSQVNINTAPKEVLQALDSAIDSSTADRIIEQRRIKHFENIGDVNTRVPGTVPGLGNNMFVYEGKLFRITSVGRVKDSSRTVEAVVRLTGEVLSWQEY